MAKQLGNRAINQRVAGSIPGRVKLRCVLGQGTYAFLDFLDNFLYRPISEYRIFKSPNICISIGLKNPLSVGL